MNESQPGSISTKNAYFAFALLFLLYMFDYIDRLVIVSLFPFLQEDWGLNDKQCGMLVSAVYWSIILFTFPISLLVDRWSRKKSIGLMALVWGVATAACAYTRNFAQLFTMRTVIGVGEAGYAPGGTAMIAALFPEKKRAMVMGWWNASIPLGSAIGIALGGIVAHHWGWRHAFGLVAIPGIIIALLFFFVKDYQTVDLVKKAPDRPEAFSESKPGFLEIASEFWHTRSLMFTFVAFSGCTFVTTSLMSWLPTYYNRVEGLPMDKAGIKGSIIMLMAIIGAPLGGFLADKWYARRRNARLLFAALSSFATALFLFVALVVFKGNVQYGFFLAAGVTAVMFLPGGAAVTQDVVHPGLRAISYSLCVIVQNLLGSSLGPVFVGAVSDRFADPNNAGHGITVALSTLPAFILIAGLLFLAGSMYYNRDVDKVAKVDLNFEE